MAKKSLSIEDIGKGNAHSPEPTSPQSAYDLLPVLPRDEALNIIAKEALRRANMSFGSFNQNARLAVDDRVAGAVYTTLCLLQEGTESIPPFKLIPNLPVNPDMNSFSTPTVTIVKEDAKEIPRSMRQPNDFIECGWPREPMVLVATPEQPQSLCSAFMEVYDHMRDRYAACARDLFRSD